MLAPPYSEACERNKLPILKILKQYLIKGDVLEVGHGTGQHALYFASNLNVTWYPSDVSTNNWMIESQLKTVPLNLKSPLSLEIGSISMQSQLGRSFSHVFTANTLHIMSEAETMIFCQEVSTILDLSGLLIIYGPFKFNNHFTSLSNQQFDSYLKFNKPTQGIRDFEKISQVLQKSNIHFQKRFDLPANNQILVFKKNE